MNIFLAALGNVKVAEGGGRSGPGRRREAGSGGCASERAGESSTVLFGRSKLCARLAWSAHLALSSVQLLAVNNRINTQYCWLLPFYVSSGSNGWEMFGFVSLQTEQHNHTRQ